MFRLETSVESKKLRPGDMLYLRYSMCNGYKEKPTPPRIVEIISNDLGGRRRPHGSKHQGFTFKVIAAEIDDELKDVSRSNVIPTSSMSHDNFEERCMSTSALIIVPKRLRG